MRLALRLLLGTFAVVALAAILLGEVFLAQVKPGVRQAQEDTLADLANLLAPLAADELVAGTLADGDFARRVRGVAVRDAAALRDPSAHDTTVRVTVTDAQGIVVFDSTGRDVGADHSRWNDVVRTLRGEYGARSTATEPDDPASTVMHVASPVRTADGRIVGVLTVAKPNRGMQPIIDASRRTVLGWGVALLVFALVMGALSAAWLSRQLGVLRRYAQAATAGERAPPPAVAGEFAELGQALYTMRERLEGKQHVERTVQALAHELKSPLAAIRANAELLERPLPPDDQARFATGIGVQGERLTRLVERLLALAAVEHRQRLEDPQPVDVPALLRQVADDTHARREARSQVLEIDIDGTPQVAGDALLLRQAIGNLVDNASDFGPAGEPLRVQASRDGNDIVIAVSDHGPGVPDYARPRLFERFYSLPRPGGGERSSGLGLCLVAEVAQLHGGHVALAETAATTFVLRIPANRT